MCDHHGAFQISAAINRQVKDGRLTGLMARVVFVCAACGEKFVPKIAGVMGELEVVPVSAASLFAMPIDETPAAAPDSAAAGDLAAAIAALQDFSQ